MRTTARNGGGVRVVPLPKLRGAVSAPGPRIGGQPLAHHPWYARLILDAQWRKYGQEPEPARIWGRIPRAFLTLTLLYRSLDRATSPIAPELRSLVQVRVSQINGCTFCVDLNSAAAIERSPLSSARPKAALAYAEAMTDSRRGVDGALFGRLRSEFDEDEIVELTAAVAFQNMSSKFNAALGVPAQGFCAAPGAKEDA